MEAAIRAKDQPTRRSVRWPMSREPSPNWVSTHWRTTTSRASCRRRSEILELAPGGEELLARAGVGWAKGLLGRPTLGAGLDSQAGYALLSEEPVIVENL